jgi:hypothetical protein
VKIHVNHLEGEMVGAGAAQMQMRMQQMQALQAGP